MGRKLTHRPSFFKILIGDFTERLTIPPCFIKHFNGMVPHKSILRGPSGGLWHLKIDNVENKLVFHEGWSDFVKDHSLEYGDILTFKYIGKSKFAVKIFSRSACEKELPMSKKNINKSIPKKKKDRRQKAKKRPAVNNGMEGEPEASCSFKARSPYFTSSWNQNKKTQLGIPRKFLGKLGDELSDAVVLKDSVGKVWPIELRKANGKVWLHNGWQEFVEYHCLCDQYLLYFRYNGNSQFHVLIFDTSVDEVEHSTDSGNHKEANLDTGSQLPDDKEEEEEESLVVVGSSPSQTRAGSRKEEVDGNASIQPPQRWDSSSLPQRSLQLSADETKSESNKRKSRTPSESPKSSNCRFTRYRKKMIKEQEKAKNIFDQTESDRDETRRGSLVFSSEDDVVSIHSSNSESSKTTLPQTSPNTENEVNKAPSNNIGATQPSTPFGQDVGVQIKGPNKENEVNKAPSNNIGATQPSTPFGQDVGVQINGSNRNKSVQSRFPQQEHSKGEVSAVQIKGPNKENEVNKAPSNNIGATQPSTPFGQDVGVQINGSNRNKSVQSRFPQQEHSKGEVSAGRGNQRTQPYVLREPTIKQEAKEHSSGLPVAEIYSPYKRSSAILGRERAFQVECAFDSKHPFFTVTMRPSYLCKRYLHIPSRFASKYLITKGIKVVRLRSSGTKVWPVAYIVRSGSTQLIDGWYSFLDDNKLREDDICVFELININDLEMKVSIFRFIKNVATQIFPAN